MLNKVYVCMYVGWSSVGFFNPVIPTLMFAQFRNPEGYFEHPANHAYFKSQVLLPFCFEIPNPGLQIRQLPDPE